MVYDQYMVIILMRSGNNINDWASFYYMMQIVRSLLSRRLFHNAVGINTKNAKGFTALDNLNGQKGIDKIEIRKMLRRAGASGNLSDSPLPTVKPHKVFVRYCFVFWYAYMVGWCQARQQINKLNLETRSMVLVVMGLIVTTTYQTTLSPPGGLWQDNYNATTNGGNNPSPPPHKAGTAMMGSSYFIIFVGLNSACFLISLIASVVLLPPLLWRFCVPLMIYFIISYVLSVRIISPSKLPT